MRKKRLGAIVGMFILFLIIRTLMAPPKGIKSYAILWQPEKICINQVIILMPFSMREYELHHQYAC